MSEVQAVAGMVATGLDAAWAAAEAALPEGWRLHSITVMDGGWGLWLAVAGRPVPLWQGRNSESGSGPTPADALLALAAALRPTQDHEGVR